MALDFKDQQLSELKTTNNIEELSARQRADRKYKAKLKSINLRFRPQDMPLLEHLKQQPNMNKYIKTLIAKDMGYKTWEHYTGLVPTEKFHEEREEDRKLQLNIAKMAKLELEIKELNRKIRNAKKKAREKAQLQIGEHLFEICGWTGRNKDNYIEELDIEKFKSFCNKKKRAFIKHLKHEQCIEKPKEEKR